LPAAPDKTSFLSVSPPISTCRVLRSNLGAHVRVGLKDNLLLAHGRLESSDTEEVD
jgi:uncharacterized protein (DUF849 family)